MFLNRAGVGFVAPRIDCDGRFVSWIYRGLISGWTASRAVFGGEQPLDKVPQVADIAFDFVSGHGELNEMYCRHSLQETQ